MQYFGALICEIYETSEQYSNSPSSNAAFQCQKL